MAAEPSCREPWLPTPASQKHRSLDTRRRDSSPLKSGCRDGGLVLVLGGHSHSERSGRLARAGSLSRALRKGLGGAPGAAPRGSTASGKWGGTGPPPAASTDEGETPPGREGLGLRARLSQPWPFSQLAPGPARPPALAQARDFSLGFLLGTERFRPSARQTGACTSAVLNPSLAWARRAPRASCSEAGRRPAEAGLRPGSRGLPSSPAAGETLRGAPERPRLDPAMGASGLWETQGHSRADGLGAWAPKATAPC